MHQVGRSYRSEREGGLGQCIMLLRIGQVQGTRGCILGQPAVYCCSGRIASSSVFCYVLRSIAACAVGVDGELCKGIGEVTQNYIYLNPQGQVFGDVVYCD